MIILDLLLVMGAGLETVAFVGECRPCFKVLCPLCCTFFFTESNSVLDLPFSKEKNLSLS